MYKQKNIYKNYFLPFYGYLWSVIKKHDIFHVNIDDTLKKKVQKN